MHINRRQFLQTAGITGLSLLVGGCGRPATPAPGEGASDSAEEISGKIRFWAHYGPLVPVWEALFKELQSAHSGLTLEHEHMVAGTLRDALAAGFRSKDAPDIFSIAGMSPQVLYGADWTQPLEPHIDDAWKKRFPPGTLLEGHSVFEGKLYGLPISDSRWFLVPWFNKQMMEDAGYDPETGPTSWDEFRDAAKKMTGDGKAGLIGGYKNAGPLGAHVLSLAVAAGAPVSIPIGGPTGGINWKTGEYVQDTDPFVEAFELIKSIKEDGLLFAGSSTLNPPTARARWVSGVAGMFFDGPWCMGVLLKDLEDAMDKVWPATLPTPNGEPPTVHRAPPKGGLWISALSQNPELAGLVLKAIGSPEVFKQIVMRMDQPTPYLEEEWLSETHPAYRQAMQLYGASAFYGPDPVSRNLEQMHVVAEMKPVHPNLGEICQGVLAGEIDDFRSAAKEYVDKLTAERERAIKTVRERDGAEVDINDWIFADWEPGRNFTEEDYQSL